MQMASHTALTIHRPPDADGGPLGRWQTHGGGHANLHTSFGGDEESVDTPSSSYKTPMWAMLTTPYSRSVVSEQLRSIGYWLAALCLEVATVFFMLSMHIQDAHSGAMRLIGVSEAIAAVAPSAVTDVLMLLLSILPFTQRCPVAASQFSLFVALAAAYLPALLLPNVAVAGVRLALIVCVGTLLTRRWVEFAVALVLETLAFLLILHLALTPPEGPLFWLGIVSGVVGIIGCSLVVIFKEQATVSRELKRYFSSEGRAALLSAVVDPLLVMDQHGNLQEANDAGARMLGCTRTEMQHLCFDDLVVLDQDSTGEDCLTFSELVKGLSQAPGGLTGQRSAFRHRDGKVIPVSMSLGFWNGQTSIIACLHDMRPYMEKQRKLNQAALEHKVLTKSMNLRRQFLRYIFHEVRVPFNVLTLGIDAVNTDITSAAPGSIAPELASSMQSTLSMMQEQAGSMSRILDDVLSMQRIEENRLQLEVAPCSLRHLASSVARSFAAAYVAAGVRFEPHIKLNLNKMVLADFCRLQQVLSNFLSNAIKFTPRDGVVTLSMVELGSMTAISEFMGDKPVFLVPNGDDSRGRQLPNTVPPVSGESGVWDENEAREEEAKRDPFTLNVPPTPTAIKAPVPATRKLNSMESFEQAQFRVPAESFSESWRHRTSVSANGARSKGNSVTSVTAPPPATIRMFDGWETLPQQWILFAVKDSGVGISKRDMTKLFVPYVQIAAGELQKGRGTGLGLSIAKHIVEAHGGRIGVASEPNVGSEFFFAIPFRVTNDMDKQLESGAPSVSDVTAAAAAAAVPASPVPGVRVLIVEDSMPNQLMLRRVMERAGHVVAVAENGQECLSLVMPALQRGEECPFDLMLMDKEMPVMNGMEATKALRAAGVKIPILALTGNALKEDQDAFLAAGANRVLIKPVLASQLGAAVREALHGAGASSGADTPTPPPGSPTPVYGSQP